MCRARANHGHLGPLPHEGILTNLLWLRLQDPSEDDDLRRRREDTGRAFRFSDSDGSGRSRSRSTEVKAINAYQECKKALCSATNLNIEAGQGQGGGRGQRAGIQVRGRISAGVKRSLDLAGGSCSEPLSHLFHPHSHSHLFCVCRRSSPATGHQGARATGGADPRARR